MRTILVIIILLPLHVLFAQKSFSDLHNNSDFRWKTDSAIGGMKIYYTDSSWTANNLHLVHQRLTNSLTLTKQFIQIENYKPIIHLFIVESRAQMKLLIGHETNGSAYYKHNTVTGIASINLKSIFSNHEIFHVIAMNTWGVPDTWINEGMAVYSDNQWHGYDLYALTSYLVDNKRVVPLAKMIRNFRNVDSLVSYPLMGSFVKFIDEVYGRDVLIKIWKGNQSIRGLTGKSIQDLEEEWLNKVKEISYSEIKY